MAHWSDVSAPERAAYANGLRDCARELRQVLAAQEPRPALTVTTSGYQGAAQHTYTAACDGFHEPGPCPGPQDARVRMAADLARLKEGLNL